MKDYSLTMRLTRRIYVNDIGRRYGRTPRWYVCENSSKMDLGTVNAFNEIFASSLVFFLFGILFLSEVMLKNDERTF